jgi:hypothetical protein
VKATAPSDTTAQVRDIYDLLFGRAPQARELEAARNFLLGRSSDQALKDFAQVLLSSSEFSFID